MFHTTCGATALQWDVLYLVCAVQAPESSLHVVTSNLFMRFAPEYHVPTFV